MKKFLICVAGLILFLSGTRIALANSFEISTGGTFNPIGWEKLNYPDKALASSFNLGEGETSDTLDYFRLKFSDLFFGKSTTSPSMALLELISSTDLADQEGFLGIAPAGFIVGAMWRGEPVGIEDGHKGTKRLISDLCSLKGITCGSELVIQGKVTNKLNTPSPTRVPEPSTYMLVGFGLVGLAGARRIIKRN